MRMGPILAAEMENLLLDLDRRSVGVPFRNGWVVHQTGVAVFSIGFTPTVEAAATDPKISAGLRNMPSLSACRRMRSLRGSLLMCISIVPELRS